MISLRSLLFLILSLLIFAVSASAEKWPTIDDLYVGYSFKYPIKRIRVTQAAAGFRAVALKQAEMEELTDDELKNFLRDDPIPVVAAPDGHFYQVDHHHQALAAYRAGRESAYYELVNDYSKLKDMKAFWTRMSGRQLVRGFDENGKPIKIPDELPQSVLSLKDDPFRSLAWFVRKSGGYRKSSVKFAEFLWADFFRTRIELGQTKKEFNVAVVKSEVLAHTADAKHLPGWQKKRVDDCGEYVRAP